MPNDETTALRARVRELEEEIATLRTIARNHYSDENHLLLATRIKRAFPVRGVGPARMLALLYVARRPLTKQYISESIPPRDAAADRTDGVIKVWASEIRNAAGPDMLAHERPGGYSLTPEGRERLRAALERD